MRGWFGFAPAVLAAAWLGLPIGAVSSHERATTAGVIYFTATRNGERTAMYRVNPDGTGLQRLPHLRLDERQGTDSFSVSPTAKAIAYVFDERVYFARVDGSDPHPEAARFGDASTWSPDGRSSLRGRRRATTRSMSRRPTVRRRTRSPSAPRASPPGRRRAT